MQKPFEERFNAFKKYRNKLNTLTRNSKEYYNKRFESVKNNLRKKCKTINSIIGRKRVIRKLILMIQTVVQYQILK